MIVHDTNFYSVFIQYLIVQIYKQVQPRLLRILDRPLQRLTYIYMFFLLMFSVTQTDHTTS